MADDDFEGSAVGKLLQKQQKNPAAPTGLQTGAKASYGVQSGDPMWAGSSVGKLFAQGSYADSTKSWFSGQNTYGTENGWDNDFYDTYYNSYLDAAKNGGLNSFFDRPDVTGVVTWDHDSEDGKKHFAFGDIYQDGNKLSLIHI